MGRKEIHELLDIALDIIEKGRGENGYPYVYMSVSNYGTELRIEIMDDGFRPGHTYDGIYEFDIRGEISERRYNACKEHLNELREKVKGVDDVCMDTSAHAAETI